MIIHPPDFDALVAESKTIGAKAKSLLVEEKKYTWIPLLLPKKNYVHNIAVSYNS